MAKMYKRPTMGSRNPFPDRCNYCQVRRDLCFCSEIPKIQTLTKVVVLIHYREVKRPTNTGQLAHQILTNSELRIRGLPNNPMDTENLISPDRQSILLFPTEDADALTMDAVEKFSKPITLIVPDGNWRQASKMPKRISQISKIPRFKVPIGEPSEYRLRAEPRSGGLATIEAIARALRIIEGNQVANILEETFRTKVTRTLFARSGQIPKELSIFQI